MKHIPTAIGLLLCDEVIVAEGTRNVTPVNCFNTKVLPAIPGSTSFLVLAWLSDGEGELLAELVIRRLDTLEEIYQDQQVLTFVNRLHDARFLARIRSCTFPVEGYYEVGLRIGGEFVAHRRFRIQEGRAA